MANENKQSFLQGALVLIIANILIKVIGAIFKIPLDNLIGADGMGLFLVAYYLYNMMFVLSTAGLPVAVSRMVAESNALGKGREVKKIVKVALALFLSIGALFSIVMFVGAGFYVESVQNSRAYLSVLAIAPAVFFVAIMSVYRGYYQGMSNMYPTAISQVIEALSKLLLGYTFAYILLKKGYGVEVAAAGAIAGVTIGTVLGALYLTIKKRTDKTVIPETSDECRSSKALIGKLIAIAIPITIGSAVLSVTNLIDTMVVLRRLQSIGFSEVDANVLYGAYSVKAVSLMTLPQTLIVALTVSLIPAISAANARMDYLRASRTADSALRCTCLIAFPCAAGIGTLSWPILNLLFVNTDEVNIAAPMLTMLAPAVVFVALVSVTNSIMQAAGRERLTVVSMIVGCVVKLTCNYILVGTPSINISGAPIGTLCCYASIATLNLIILYKKTNIAPRNWASLIKPAIAAAVMGVCAYFSNMLLTGLIGVKLAVLVSIVIAVVVYFGVIIAIKGLYKEDMLMLPKGEKLVKLLRL
ncbi:MAG: polysaccharide biosynthesis protein [Clostridiales bacterium]|nr:polysaccharide biosynthesis protein [Clostridiales bacterium]